MQSALKKITYGAIIFIQVGSLVHKNSALYENCIMDKQHYVQIFCLLANQSDNVSQSVSPNVLVLIDVNKMASSKEIS